LRNADIKRGCRHPCNINSSGSSLPRLEIDCKWNMPWHIESVEIYIRHMLVIVWCCYIYIREVDNGKNSKSFCLSYSCVVRFPPASMFSKMIKYEANVHDSVVSLTRPARAGLELRTSISQGKRSTTE
jgi:hypothetical protein